VSATSEPPEPIGADELELIDFRHLGNLGGFVLRSVRRRKLLAAFTFLAVAAASLGALAVVPRTYHVETQLLAQRNSLMPALGNPGRAVPFDADVPTRAAPEAVLRRDNLLSLMVQTDLLRQWSASRPVLGRAKDWLQSLLLDPPSDEERTTAMVEYLEHQLKVTTGDNTITISIDWPDAPLAYRLVDAAQQNFLEQRHGLEVSAIAETISILEGHAAKLHDDIEAALDEVTQAQANRTGRSRPAVATAAPPVRRDAPEEPVRFEGPELKVLIDTKQRAINELEQFRRRRLAELQAELTHQRTIYADAHPNVQQLLQSIAALQQDSPQLQALRHDEADLVSRYEKVRPVEAAALARRRSSTTASSSELAAEDPGGEIARTRLRFAMAKYDSVLERIDGARIELDTARAAFKYRYSMIRPPTLPKRPEKPRIPVMLMLGLAASVAFTFLVTTLADWRSGKVLEVWQLERTLAIPRLGVVPISEEKAAA